MEIDSLFWRVTPDLLCLVDKDGRFKKVNPAWCRTLDYAEEVFADAPFLSFVHPDDVARTEAAFVGILNGLPVLNFENRYAHADGSYRWLSWNSAPEGDVFFCSARDITEAKEKAASLRTREEEAEFRDQFIAVLSHDLRNPVAAVEAAIRILRREPQSDHSLEVINLAETSLSRMSSLIFDVMDFARARLGQGLGIERDADCSLRQIIIQTIQELRIAHPSAIIEEHYDFDAPVSCDGKRIAQLVSNLVSNALVHGDDTSPVRVAAAIEGAEFVLSVSNKGDPIPEAARVRLFSPFTRLGKEDDGGGLGLGLYIANQIAKGHDGALSVSSEGRTTVFRLAFPI